MDESLVWMQDPQLADIPAHKLDFLQKMFFESKNLTEKERMPFFLSLAAKSRKEQITFTEEETTRIIQVLKGYATPQDIDKIDRFIHMAKQKGTS